MHAVPIIVLWCISGCFADFSTSLPNATSSPLITTPNTSISDPPTTTSSANQLITTRSSEQPSTWSSSSQTTLNLMTSDVTTSQGTSPSITMTTSELRTSTGVPAPIRCPDGSYNEFGTLASGPNGNCESAADCMGVGPALNMSLRLDVSCVFNTDESASRCCYNDTSTLCRFGVSVLPSESCESSDDCNLRVGMTTERWCDARTKMCCRHEHQEHQMLCPDGVTAVMNEELCTHFNPKNISSGKCPNEGGICHYGHCCPPKSKPPGTPYKTTYKCTNSSVMEEGHINGYCDPRTGRVWIMSELNFHGQKNRAMMSFCLSSRDCGQSSGRDYVCVRTAHKVSNCYRNPEEFIIDPEHKNLNLISISSYIALGTAILSLLFSVLYKTVIIDRKFPGETSENQELISQCDN